MNAFVSNPHFGGLIRVTLPGCVDKEAFKKQVVDKTRNLQWGEPWLMDLQALNQGESESRVAVGTVHDAQTLYVLSIFDDILKQLLPASFYKEAKTDKSAVKCVAQMALESAKNLDVLNLSYTFKTPYVFHSD